MWCEWCAIPGGGTGGEAGEPVVAGERAHGVQTQGAILPRAAVVLQSASELAVAAFAGGEPVGPGDAFGEEGVESAGALGAQCVHERKVPLGDR